MLIYTFWDILAVFGYGFLAGVITPFVAVFIASCVGRSTRGK